MKMKGPAGLGAITRRHPLGTSRSIRYKIWRMRVQVRCERMGSVFLVWLLISFSLAAQTGGPPAPSPTEAQVQLHADLERAADAMHKGELSVAAESLRQALRIDPHSLAALNNLGIVLSREGKPAEAIPLYEEALKVRPGDQATQRNLAVAYFKAQRYRSAWSLLQPMAVAYPNDFQILDLAGLSLFALDRYPEAAKYLERANQAQPSDLETLDMLGKAYLRMKDYKALTSVFARIMQVNPNSAPAHIMMATAYDQMDNRPEAIKEYQAAAAADPTFTGVHSGLGFEYWRQGDNDLAEKEFRAELQRFPNDPVSNCILGQILSGEISARGSRDSSSGSDRGESSVHGGFLFLRESRTGLGASPGGGGSAAQSDPDRSQRLPGALRSRHRAAPTGTNRGGGQGTEIVDRYPGEIEDRGDQEE